MGHAAPRARAALAELKSCWPQTLQDAADAFGYTPPTVRLAPASPKAIDRMHETFTWFCFLEGMPHLTRAVWLTAACGMGPNRALDRIAEGVQREEIVTAGKVGRR